jgi:hypothetical protein
LFITSQQQQMNFANNNNNNNINMRNDGINDIIKLNVSFGAEREYILVHGKKPITIRDLKNQLFKTFKIPVEYQNIVYKGYNLHEYVDDAPLTGFGLENNSNISIWPKATITHPDLRLPAKSSSLDHSQNGDLFAMPHLNPMPPLTIQPKW